MKQKRIDEIVMSAIGEESSELLEQASFEFACFEADYLNVPKKGEPFKELCILRRNDSMRDAYELIVDNPEVLWYAVEFVPISRRRIKKIIEEKYKSRR